MLRFYDSFIFSYLQWTFLNASTYFWALDGLSSHLSSSSTPRSNMVPPVIICSILTISLLSFDQMSWKRVSLISPIVEWPEIIFLLILILSMQAARHLSPLLGVLPHPFWCVWILHMFLKRMYKRERSRSEETRYLDWDAAGYNRFDCSTFKMPFCSRRVLLLSSSILRFSGLIWWLRTVLNKSLQMVMISWHRREKFSVVLRWLK